MSRKRGRNGSRNARMAAQLGINLPDMSESTLSPNDVGNMLGLTGEAVKQWIYARRLPAIKISNGYWKIKKEDLERFLKARGEVRQKILAFSSDSSIARIVQGAAAMAKIDVTESCNVVDAMLKANDCQPSLIVADVDDPSGWDLISRTRAHRNLAHMPILALAGHELSNKELDDALSFGVLACLPKNIPVDGLHSELQRILACRR